MTTEQPGFLERLIRFAIAHRWLMLLLTAALCALGVWSFTKLPIDATPDITNVQVQINTEAPGYSPLESEQRVTFPIETAIAAGEAVAAYERAVALRPDQAVARFNLASALLDLGRWAEAIPPLERALVLNPQSSDSHRALGFALVQLGRGREAMPHYEAVLRADPADAEARRALTELRSAPPR